MAARGWVWREGTDHKEAGGNFWNEANILYLDYSSSYITAYVLQNSWN